MKLDQIAYYAHDHAQADVIKRAFNIADGEWVVDYATGKVSIHRPGEELIEGRSTGVLQFNYELGIELEILTYLDGPHWHEKKAEFQSRVPFLSHLGMHMDEGERPPERVLSSGVLVQTMDTESHTNSYLVEMKRTYHYEIYSMPFGPDLKYIWRIEA